MRSSADTLIVTPTLGRRPTLECTVESVQVFGGGRVTHALVSPRAVQADLHARFRHCLLVPERENGGVYAAVNRGLAQADENCRYVGYINDDDYWLPGFQRLFNILDSDDDVMLAYGRLWYVDSRGARVFESASTPRYQAFAELLAAGVPPIAQQAVLMRKEVFLALGGFNTEYQLVADTDFFLRAVRRGFKMRYHDCACATYRIQDNQLSSDVRLGEAEHRRMLANHAIRRTGKSAWELALFRIRNMPLYLRRAVCRGSWSVKGHFSR